MDNKEKEESKAHLAQLEIARCYAATFSTKEGEKVLAHLMKEFNMMRSTYAGDIDDCIFSEGQRNVVLHILGKMNVNVTRLKQAYEQNEEGKEYGYFE